MTIELDNDLLTSLVSPRAVHVEREEFAPWKRAVFEDVGDKAVQHRFNALDGAFDDFGSG